MNKIGFTIVLIVSFYSTFGQLITAKEPEYIGNVVFAKENQTMELEKQKVSVTSSSGFAIYAGGIKESLKIKGSNSTVNFKGEELNFIAKVNDNNIDPFELIQIYRFAVNSDSRKLIVSNSGFGGTKEGDLERIKFSAKKYGEKSFLITLTDYPFGEYGININISNNSDSKVNGITFHLFSVHPKVGDLVAYKAGVFNDEVWYGLVKEQTKDDVILKTSDKGMDFTKKISIDKLTAVRKVEFPVFPNNMQKDTIFGVIHINDKVKLYGNLTTSDAIYLGTINQKLVILSTTLGKPSIKEIELTENKNG